MNYKLTDNNLGNDFYPAIINQETFNKAEEMRLELQYFIARQKTDITEFDEALANKLIEKITVFADRFTVEFKSGITIEIEV